MVTVKHWRRVALLLALALGGGLGYLAFQRGAEQDMGTPGNPPVTDPYGQLGQKTPATPPADPNPPAPEPQTPPADQSVTTKPQESQPQKPPSQSPQVPPKPEQEKSKADGLKAIPALPADFKLPPAIEIATGPLPSNPRPDSPDHWYAIGKERSSKGDHRRAAAAFAQAAALNPSAANWRALADEYVALGQYAAATRAYEQAARRYRKGGDDMTARALEHLAAPYRQTVTLQLVAPKTAPTQTKLARFEPPRGVLLGIHVAADGVQGAWGQPAHLTPRFKPFAVAFRYWKLTRSKDPALIFPGRFAGAVRANGQALHLALEPGMPLKDISDKIIHDFARAAKAAELPIFVRFASEMNDPQNDWSGDPALYRRTFARLARILHAEAPNVALVWMPMPGDLSRIADYYPGPDAVDWAGLSLYSVPFENGDLNRPRLTAHPLEVIDGFYRQYASKHPIQLSEYAASHHSGAAPGQDFGAFAAQQMREVYWGALMQYPRLKNINWLDIDMHTDPLVRQRQPERRNDYRLFNTDAKWKTFKRLLAEPAFWQSFTASQCRTCTVDAALPWPMRLTPQQTRAGVSGQLWVQTARPAASVKLLLNHRELQIKQALPYRFRLGRLAPGQHLLTVRVLDGAGKLLLEEHKLFLAR